MMHEHHARFVMEEHQRRLRDATELARLVHEASLAAPRRRRWALLRQRGAEVHSQPEAVPAFPRASLPRRAVP
jgi:hypothetical protein